MNKPQLHTQGFAQNTTQQIDAAASRLQVPRGGAGQTLSMKTGDTLRLLTRSLSDSTDCVMSLYLGTSAKSLSYVGCKPEQLPQALAYHLYHHTGWATTFSHHP